MASRTMKALKRGRANVYNAKGSPEEHESMEDTAEFKKGGVAKKKKDHEKLKHGGYAEGKEPKMRADKKPRGHHAKGGKTEEHMKRGGHMEHHKRASGGRTPYTSGSVTTDMSKGDKDNGHESERPEG